MIIKIKNNITIILVVFAAFSIFSSCKQVIVKVEKIPKNTPAGADLYITGNFNLWDPGDETYRLIQNSDKSYYTTLPSTFGRIKYKFTRGDWTTVEKDKCGNEKDDRYAYTYESDTLFNIIESWSDLDPLNCDSVTIVLIDLPENTPEGDDIMIAGNFNAWNPADDNRYRFKKDSMGRLTVAIPRSFNKDGNKCLYKIVRGDISRPEADKFGNDIDKRVLDFEKGDTVRISVTKWKDLLEYSKNRITIILSKIPENTPKRDYIFLVGNFNNWWPRDINYIFGKNKEGLNFISIPRHKYGLAFKITRGSWEKEAAHQNGIKLDNLEYNYDEIDTIYLEIERWLDL